MCVRESLLAAVGMVGSSGGKEAQRFILGGGRVSVRE